MPVRVVQYWVRGDYSGWQRIQSLETALAPDWWKDTLDAEPERSRNEQEAGR